MLKFKIIQTKTISTQFSKYFYPRIRIIPQRPLIHSIIIQQNSRKNKSRLRSIILKI
jgi:hypothetical protein